MSSQSTIKWLEGICLGLSGLGVSALLYYQQVVWVAAPIIPLLGAQALNIASRRQSNQSSNERPAHPSQTINTQNSTEVSAVQVSGVVTIEELERLLIDRLNQTTKEQVDAAFAQKANEFNNLLRNIQPVYEYKLIFDRVESRRILMEALSRSRKRLILVCPWPSRNSIDDIVLEKLENILKRGGCIDVGWGYYKDVEQNRVGQGDFYNALGSLKRLAENRPNQFRLKLIGTHEKYLVCDEQFAMLSSHNFLTSGSGTREREAGLRTNDPHIIDRLIRRFDEAENLNVS